MIIRAETPADAAAIAQIVERAFGRPDEAHLVDRIQSDGDLVLSLVAAEADRLVGHVLFSRLEAPFRAVALAPVSVLPEQQNQGIGTALIEDGLKRLAALGWEGVFVLGEPAYYERFGFRAELAKDFTSPYAGPYFLALSLAPALPAPDGRIGHAPAFADLE